MNMAHDHKPPLPGEAQERATEELPELRLPIDWQALRARLFAARQLQAALDPQATQESLRLRLRGSFDGCAASVLTTYQGTSTSVNPDASSNGKPAEGTFLPVADRTSTGARGQK